MTEVITLNVPAGTKKYTGIPGFRVVNEYISQVVRSIEVVSGNGTARIIVGCSELPWIAQRDGRIETYIIPATYHDVNVDIRANPNSDMVVQLTLETIDPIPEAYVCVENGSYGGYPIHYLGGMVVAPAPEMMYHLRYLNIDAINADYQTHHSRLYNE